MYCCWRKAILFWKEHNEDPEYPENAMLHLPISLFEAAENGDKEKIEYILGREDSSSCFTFNSCCAKNHPQVRRVDINMKFDGKTILHVAALNGHVKLVEFLCKSGANIDIQDHKGLTPLRTAVFKNHLEVVKVLLNHKADTKGSFRMALNCQSKSMALILIKYGTLVDICKSRCSDSKFLNEVLNILLNIGRVSLNDVLECAAVVVEENIVKQLFALGTDVNLKSDGRLSPLHFAISNKLLSIIESPLNNGTDFNCAIDYRGIALSCVTRQASIITSNDPYSQEKFAYLARITEMILKTGDSLNYHDFQGFTALHYAVGIEKFWPKIVRLLLDNGADINAVDISDATPIFYTQNAMILEMLIERGANVNYVSQKLFTPLAHMFYCNRLSCVKVLLRNGTDVNIQNSEGKTIVEIHGHLFYDKSFEILKGIINKNSDINHAIRHLGHDQSPKFIETLAAMIVKRTVAEEISINVEYLETNNPHRYRYFCSRISMCEIEINRLKSTKINIRNLSVFDILVMPINELFHYVERNELLKLESNNAKKDFPIYADMLQRQIEIAKYRRVLIDSSAEAFRKLIFHHLEINLPELVVYKIVPMLSNFHLLNLAGAWLNFYNPEISLRFCLSDKDQNKEPIG